MKSSLRTLLSIWVVSAVLAACDKDKPEDTADALPCWDGTAWEEGQEAFRDATSDWGLDAIGATGTRLVAVDFDGDGWTDLAVRAAGEGEDDFSEGGARYSWLLRNTGQGTFEDITAQSGVLTRRDGEDRGRPGQVWAFADVDNDGDLDVFTGLTDLDGTWSETSEIMLNDGAGGFTLGDAGGDIRYGGETSPAGASFVDYDRDGLVDLWIPEYYYANDRLYRNRGGGRFEDVTYDAGLTTTSWSSISNLNEGLSHSVAWSGLACDLNGDGSPELMASSYGRAPNLLWQGSADGTFTNRSVASGYAYDHRTDWSDNESARCWCHLHPEAEDCEGVPAPEHIQCTQDSHAFRWDHDYDRELFRLGGNSGTTVCADVDNDGHMDLLTTEIVHWDVGSSSDPSELLFNTGEPDVLFERPGNDVTGLTREHSGVSWDDGDMTGAVFDFDNDGWPDVLIGSSDYPDARALLWHNQGGREFVPVPVEAGLNHNRSHGVAIADFDRDGDLDVVLGHSSARCSSDCYDSFHVRFFENLTAPETNFIQLRLEGASANRSAIGARVSVTTGEVTQTQEVGGGHGHYGIQHDLVLHFGLGAACEAQVTVRWPDQELTEETASLQGGGRYHWVQGSDPALDQ